MTANKIKLYLERMQAPYVMLVTLDHDKLLAPVRVTTNSSAITSNGEEFISGRIELIPPNSNESESTARLGLANVDRRIGEISRKIDSPATVLFQVIDATEPDVIDQTWPPMFLTNISGDELMVTAELRSQIDRQDPYPNVIASKSNAPGLYA